MNSWMLYAIDVVGGLQSLMVGIAVIAATCSIMAGVIYVVNVCTGDDTALETMLRILKAALVSFGVTALIAVFVPSRSSLLLIYTAQHLNAEEVKKLPDNVVKALNTYLEDMVKDKGRSK